MQSAQKITPCLWFDDQAEAAAAFYTSIFPNSQITAVTCYNGAGQEIHGKPAGTALTVSFTLDGQAFTALNGGPAFTFNEAISLQISCDTQAEVDHYWERLAEGGDPQAQQCGWLKDRFGVSWQVTPRVLLAMLQDPDAEKTRRVTAVLLRMKKLEIAPLQDAYDGH